MRAEEFEVNGTTMVIHLKKDLDHHNAVYIREMADGYVDKYPINTIIFAFRQVEFMDSSGSGVIMGRYKQLSYVGGTVYVYDQDNKELAKFTRIV